MKSSIGFNKRVRFYFRSATIYFFAQFIAIFLAFVSISFVELIGFLIIVFIVLLIFCKYHLSIASFLLSKMKLKKRLLLMMPVFILSSLPIFLSIYYNEFILDHHLPLFQKEPAYRIVSYIFHSSWITVFFWELYYLLLTSRYLKLNYGDRVKKIEDVKRKTFELNFIFPLVFS